jgi:uncharacterized membrane protein YgcG
MTKIPASRPSSARLLLATSLFAVPVALWSLSALAAPSKTKANSKSAKTRLAALPGAKRRPAAKPSAPLPDFLPLSTLKQLRKEGRIESFPVLQPTWEGHALKTPMRDLLSGPTFDVPVIKTSAKQSNAKQSKRTMDGTRLAQAFPRPIAPASPAALRRASTSIAPRWVRYPLEFQLAGIGLGTRAVDKDRFNRIDRYGLFAMHGNPTAVVRQIDKAFLTGRGATSGAGGGGGGGGDAGGGGGDTVVGSLTLQQTPPESTSLFPSSQARGGLPDWALAVTVQLDNNHVEWLYKRDNYSMGFVVDRLGFVDAIIVAGFSSDITRTQLEDPVHTVKLGDDLRKVLFRYGYPDDIVPLANEPESAARPDTGAVRGVGTGGGGGDAGGGGGGGTGGKSTSTSIFTAPASIEAQDSETVNATWRTFDLRYEQSYNVVFTIRNNRVIRIYIFGDPDFYNAQRRNQLRTKY